MFNSNKDLDCCGIDTQKLKELRLDKNLSQDQLAAKIGTSQWNYSKLETGYQKTPSYWLICKITTFFNVPAEYLKKEK